MPDFPSTPVTPLFIHTFGEFSAAYDVGVISGLSGSASGTWPVASTAFYIPVWLPWPYPVKRVFWYNGTSVTSVNVDFGIYSADGTLIYSTGSTARSGSSSAQYVSPTPFVLPAGRYYFAHSCDSTTANRGGVTSTSPANVARCALGGLLQEASALPLPATMTPATIANIYIPLVGVTRTDSGF